MNAINFLTCQTCKKKLWVEEFTWRISGTLRHSSCRSCLSSDGKNKLKQTFIAPQQPLLHSLSSLAANTIIKTCTKCFKKIPVIFSSQPLKHPPESYNSLLNVYVCAKCSMVNEKTEIKSEQIPNTVSGQEQENTIEQLKIEQPKKRQKRRDKNNGPVYDLETLRQLPPSTFCSNQYETLRVLQTEKKLDGKTCTHCWEFKSSSAFPDNPDSLDSKGSICNLCSSSILLQKA